MPRPFAIAVLPDTQYYSWRYPEIFHAQTGWLAHADNPFEIGAVVHVGDVVQHNNDQEWALARTAFDALSAARIPYLITTGNHDYGLDGQAGDRSSGLNRFFGVKDLSAAKSFGSFALDSIENSFIVIDTPEGPFLLLALEFGPRAQIVAWANDVLCAHTHIPALVATHGYLYPDASRYDWKTKGPHQRWNPKKYPFAKADPSISDGEELWRNCLSRHVNVRLVVCGHCQLSGVAQLSSLGENGNVVHQLLANYQSGVTPDYGEGGGGYLRLMIFEKDGLRVRTYSPWRDNWLTSGEQDFMLPMMSIRRPERQ